MTLASSGRGPCSAQDSPHPTYSPELRGPNVHSAEKPCLLRGVLFAERMHPQNAVRCRVLPPAPCRAGSVPCPVLPPFRPPRPQPWEGVGVSPSCRGTPAPSTTLPEGGAW